MEKQNFNLSVTPNEKLPNQTKIKKRKERIYIDFSSSVLIPKWGDPESKFNIKQEIQSIRTKNKQHKVDK